MCCIRDRLRPRHLLSQTLAPLTPERGLVVSLALEECQAAVSPGEEGWALGVFGNRSRTVSSGRSCLSAGAAHGHMLVDGFSAQFTNGQDQMCCFQRSCHARRQLIFASDAVFWLMQCCEAGLTQSHRRDFPRGRSRVFFARDFLFGKYRHLTAWQARCEQQRISLRLATA